ncbi:hypothetical protein C8F01DRAFT_1192584 [Mycena amicta]|nr:hypothetical protein C8F01DRAFT_1192584 [Mycena amicta]
MNAPVYPRIAIVDIPGEGRGVVAREPILRGTRIIAEKPRIRVPHWLDRRQALDLSTLSAEDLSFFMSFPAGSGADPVAGRLRHLIPCVASPDEAAALFETVCRMNHTCYSSLGRPNALYTWVEKRQEEVVHATEDIKENEEITVSYIQTKNHVMDPALFLRMHYEFDCGCPGCQRPRAERLQSLERVKAYNQYNRELPAQMVPSSGHAPLDILHGIERNLLAICAEGYVWEISSSAHDAFQLCAFYGDGKSAAQWEVMSREVHRVIYGVDLDEYEDSAKLVVRPTSFRPWKALVRPGGKALRLRGPSQEVLACFKRAVFGSGAPKCANRNCSRTQAVTFQRCKPCIDKLGLDVYYCSRECQTEDWKDRHKAICGNAVKV